VTDVQSASRFVVIGALVLWVGQASAQQTAPGEQLFLEGRELMEQKRYPEACAKLKASHDLDPQATGTLLNLAVCHEYVDKPATAWAEFRQVIAESAGRREDRVAIARGHEEKLFPILPRVTLVVDAGARPAGLVIKLDARAVPEAAWGTELPVDPGLHRIEASAPGKRPATQDFEAAAGPSRQRVVIPALRDAPAPPPPSAATPDWATIEHLSALRARRTLGFVATGVGLASIGVGLALGVVAKNKEDDAKSLCPSDQCAEPAARDSATADHDAAKTNARIADVAVVAGAVLAIGGAVLVLVSRPVDTSFRRGQRAALSAAQRGLLFGATW
jgi:serine/threonine-protein kinase